MSSNKKQTQRRHPKDLFKLRPSLKYECKTSSSIVSAMGDYADYKLNKEAGIIFLSLKSKSPRIKIFLNSEVK